jgi:uncharacterized tellurite resistance protein B-like protein
MDEKRRLKGMLARIFSDAEAEASERAELEAYLASGTLTSAEVQSVFEDFVKTTWKITLADGVISEVERKRLREIVGVLGLARDALPAEWAKLLDSSP